MLILLVLLTHAYWLSALGGYLIQQETAQQLTALRMTHDGHTAPISPATISTAGERVRRHRERRQLGLRCVSLQIWDRELDELIRRGLLKPDGRDDVDEIKHAIYAVLDRALGADQ